MVILPKIAFATNASFLGGAAEDFESHVTGLNSTDLRHLDTNAYQVAAKEDDGARIIESPSIAKIASTLAPVFLHSDLPYAELGSDWLQASFTARVDGKFVGGPIRTRRDLNAFIPDKGTFAHMVVIAHLSRNFPGDPTLRIRGGSTVPTPPSPTALAVAGGAILLTVPTPNTPHTPATLPPPTPATPREGAYGAGSTPTRPLVGTPRPLFGGMRGSGSGAGGGGSGGGPAGSGIGMTHQPPPPALPVDIAAIVTAAINAAIQGIAAATAAQPTAGAAPIPTPLSPLKLLHLRMIYGVATDADIPDI